MESYPVPPKRRRRYERAIRIADLIAYFGVVVGGIAAVFVPPASATDELTQAPGLIAVWAVLLLGGGAVGFIGRLSRRWLVEGPATVAAVFGAAIYLLLLGNLALDTATTTMAASLIFTAMVLLSRRWFELQIYGTEPSATWKRRLQLAARRRTTDVVHRDDI